MPYLHWEIEEELDKRKKFIKELKGEGLGERPDWDSDQKFLGAYLRTRHRLHIRRTLDQYYYHTLEDTNKRDKDRVVSRYQKQFEEKVTTMVDQLWLWVLVGTDGRADTVVTSFPHGTTGRSTSGSNSLPPKDPDPNGLTDVLSNILLHMLTEPSLVKTAYDLAGLIASECSRAYLNTANTGITAKVLQFSEIYESSIGNVVSTFIPFVQHCFTNVCKDKTRNGPLR